jgi:hypothetical protein
MTTVDRLYSEALELSEEEQEELVARLAEHLELDALRADREWIAEMQRRAGRIETGDDAPIPGEVVLGRMWDRLENHRQG